MSYGSEVGSLLECRTPHGVRGLKYLCDLVEDFASMSHPTRGAWIEIFAYILGHISKSRRTPHGVRGLK